jgi:hypothetical protein
MSHRNPRGLCSLLHRGGGTFYCFRFSRRSLTRLLSRVDAALYSFSINRGQVRSTTLVSGKTHAVNERNGDVSPINPVSANIYAMAEPTKHLNPRLLQARWVLGGVAPEEWVDQAISALDQGFDGPALRQLAGLVRPTQRDLGHLPERALDEMGLDPCSKERAVSLLVACGATLTSKTILSLVEAFPAFSPRWRKHLEYWQGEPAGSYNDMAEFVHFVVEELYEKRRFR